VSRPVQLILLVLLVLQAKHYICDFVIQTKYQFSNKGKYGHPGGILHAGLHILGTIPAFLVVRPSLSLGAAILAAEFVIHYHVDWAKEQLMRRKRWTFPQAEFWWTFGADQVLHQLTYLAIAAALAIGAGL
jgi:hypothetical protein